MGSPRDSKNWGFHAAISAEFSAIISTVVSRSAMRSRSLVASSVSSAAHPPMSSKQPAARRPPRRAIRGSQPRHAAPQPEIGSPSGEGVRWET